jgi:Subtilase family
MALESKGEIMPDRITTYGGATIVIRPHTMAFISRAAEDRLRSNAFDIQEKLSPFSFRIGVGDADELQSELERARSLGPAYFDYAIVDDANETGSPDSEFLLTDRLFVTFSRALADTELTAFENLYGTAIVDRFSETTFLMMTAQGSDPVDVAEHIRRDPTIAEVEHDVNHRVASQQLLLPTGQAFTQQWHLQDDGTAAGFSPSVHCDEAWGRLGGFGSPDVVICVTDGAFAPEHPDFAQKIAGYGYFSGNDFVESSDLSKAELLKDGATIPQITHGTACAALAAAGQECRFSVGVAPGCRLYLAKFVIADGHLIISDAHFCRLLRAVSEKVDVISSSWGSVQPKELWSAHLKRTIALAATQGGRRGKGIVFVWAAGNSDRPLNATVGQEVPYLRIEDGPLLGAQTVGFKFARRFANNLAGLDNVVHVAASTSGARRARYSNYGDGVMLSAPSSNEAAPFGCDDGDSAPGRLIATSGFDPGAPAPARFSGTSASAPIVAGVAALVISANPELTARDVVSILKRTAEREKLDFTSYPPLACAGEGIDVSPVSPFDKGSFRDIGAPEGTWSAWFGFGRVDAGRAVESALAALPPQDEA